MSSTLDALLSIAMVLVILFMLSVYFVALHFFVKWAIEKKSEKIDKIIKSAVKKGVDSINRVTRQ